MRLLVDPAQPRIAGEALDFRDEIMAQIFDPGDPVAKRTLTFHIEVTDEGVNSRSKFFTAAQLCKLEAHWKTDF